MIISDDPLCYSDHHKSLHFKMPVIKIYGENTIPVNYVPFYVGQGSMKH